MWKWVKQFIVYSVLYKQLINKKKKKISSELRLVLRDKHTYKNVYFDNGFIFIQLFISK